jgi:uncharacterized protein
MPNSEIWAVKIKYGVAPKIGQHFHQICEDIRASRKYVIYGGEDEFFITNDVKVISLKKFMLELQV